MSEMDRAALVDELARTLYRDNPKISGTDGNAIISAPYEEGGGFAFGARCQAINIMPIIERLLAERDAQIKYLRDFAFSKACQLFEVESGKPVTKEYAGHILGSIDGNIAVSATRAVAKQGGDA